MTYKLISDNSIIRLLDGATIPLAPGNRDYQGYLEWLAEGNTPEAADPPPPPPADWRGFLQALRSSSIFQSLRLGSRTNLQINALATDLRILLGEAALGMVSPQEVQTLLGEMEPYFTSAERNEVATAISLFNIPITLE